MQCPLGHLVDRDYASVMNMFWKLTPEAWAKGVWWNLKSEEMNWKTREGDSNPIIPHPIVQYLHATLKEFKASEQSPAVLARGSPMNPAREANEDWARTPPTPFRAGRRPVHGIHRFIIDNGIFISSASRPA